MTCYNNTISITANESLDLNTQQLGQARRQTHWTARLRQVLLTTQCIIGTLDLDGGLVQLVWYSEKTNINLINSRLY